jgi:hypothetical protein
VLDKLHFFRAIASTNISFFYVPVYFMVMKRKVTKREHVPAPSGVRRQLHIGPKVTLERIVERATARVIPVPADPVKTFRGSGKRDWLNNC